jgi:hypothetical protein
MTLGEMVAGTGLFFGLIGTSLGIYNTWRDRIALRVTFQWDMQYARSDDPLALDSRFGIITVSSIGRHRVHISRVMIATPPGDGGAGRLIVIPDGRIIQHRLTRSPRARVSGDDPKGPIFPLALAES